VCINDENQVKYPWQSSVLEALVEFNPSQLRQKIAVAGDAIAKRLSELDDEAANLAERIALDDAQRTLTILKVVKS
jgi:hypothetical protein